LDLIPLFPGGPGKALSKETFPQRGVKHFWTLWGNFQTFQLGGSPPLFFQRGVGALFSLFRGGKTFPTGGLLSFWRNPFFLGGGKTWVGFGEPKKNPPGLPSGGGVGFARGIPEGSPPFFFFPGKPRGFHRREGGIIPPILGVPQCGEAPVFGAPLLRAFFVARGKKPSV